MDDRTAALKVEAGLELFNPSAVGVYHFRQATNGDTEASDSTCSVIVNAGPRVGRQNPTSDPTSISQYFAFFQYFNSHAEKEKMVYNTI